MLDSVDKVNKKYYSQIFLEERKYEIKKNKMENPVNDDFGSSSSYVSDSEPDNDSDNKSDDETDNESEKPKKYESD